MRRLKMGKTELKRVLQHKRLLAQLPDPKVPGPPPIYVLYWYKGTKVDRAEARAATQKKRSSRNCLIRHCQADTLRPHTLVA